MPDESRVTVASVAAHYHRTEKDVRQCLVSALDVLADHYGLSRDMDAGDVDDLAA